MIDPDLALRNRLNALVAAVPLRTAVRLKPAPRSIGARSWVAAVVGVVAVVSVAIIGAALGGAAGPSASPTSSAAGLTSSVSNGSFRLSLTTDATTYTETDPISAFATVEYLGPLSAISVSSHPQAVGFGVREIGGHRHVDPVSRLSLVQYSFTRGVPATYPFSKSAGTGGDPVNDAFVDWYLNASDGRPDSTLRLPPGQWQVFATFDAEGLSTAVNVDVTGVAAQATLSAVPSPTPIATGLPSSSTVPSPAPVELPTLFGTADQVCQGMALAYLQAHDEPSTVAGAFDATPAQLNAWWRVVIGRSGHTTAGSLFDDWPQDARAVLCFLDGAISGYHMPRMEPNGPDRLVLVLLGQRSDVVRYGPKDQIPVEDPKQFLGSPNPPAPPALPAPDVALPYPDGCASYGITLRRCDYLVGWAKDQNGVAANEPVSVQLLGNPACIGTSGPTCGFMQVGWSFQVRIRLTRTDGGLADSSIICDDSNYWTLICADPPTIRVHVPPSIIFGSCGGNQPCSHQEHPDPDAIAQSRIIKRYNIEIPIDHVGAYSFDLGEALLPNGVLSRTQLDLQNGRPDDVVVSADGMQLHVESLDGGPPFDDPPTRPRVAGVERVRAYVTFNVELFDPGAVIKIYLLVVR